VIALEYLHNLLGKKFLFGLLALAVLLVVVVAGPAAAEAVGWHVVSIYALYCGANSAITIGTKAKPKTPKPEGEGA
jgi:hypothetical protein